MTYQCAVVLKHLRKLANNSEPLMTFVSDANIICLSDNASVFYDYTQYCKEITGIIQSLIEQGYLVNGFNQYNFSLTQKGLHPYQLQFEKARQFLVKSIVVPILVAILTTLITLWLQK